MNRSKYRIPSMAAATLLLGGGCGDDDKGGTPGGTASGINVSRSRAADIGKAVCERDLECWPDDFNGYYDSVEDCTQPFEQWAASIDDAEKPCWDAIFDYYGCYATLGCSEDEPGCEELEDKADALCPEDEFATETPIAKASRRGRFRIPR